jgi:hypothetical protein
MAESFKFGKIFTTDFADGTDAESVFSYPRHPRHPWLNSFQGQLSWIKVD